MVEQPFHHSCRHSCCTRKLSVCYRHHETRTKCMNQATEIESQLIEAIEAFEHVLTIAVMAKDAGQGVDCDRRGAIADTLLLRGILTGFSIRQLLNPESVIGNPKLAHPDFASISVLARSVMEAFLTLQNLALTARPQEEVDLRLLWWDWHRVNEQVRARDNIGSTNPFLVSRNQEKSELRAKISAYAMRHKIPAELERQFSAGKRPTRPLFEKWREIASEAGIDGCHFDAQYQMLSAVAHSDPLIIEMLQRHDPKAPRILHSLKASVENASVYLGLMTDGVASLNPASAVALDSRFRGFISLWRAVLTTPFNVVEA